jgi:hypothetical protein
MHTHLTIIATLTLALFAACTSRSDAAIPPAPENCPAVDHTYAAWDALLAKRVRAGVVDYTGLRTADRAAFDAVLRTFEGVCKTSHDGFTTDQKLAFWINVYNAYTVELILRNWPLESIRQIGVLPGAAFRERFIPSNLRGDGLISLNDIEHEVLRKDFNEPRIHFAIVCASVSCPALRAEAYRGDRIARQLADAARLFLADETKNRYDAATKTLRLSAIFNWFGEDFDKHAGGVRSFVGAHGPPGLAGAAADPVIEHLDYDWSLNGR